MGRSKEGDELGALEVNDLTTRGRVEEGSGLLQRRDGAAVGDHRLVTVVNEEELREVKVRRSPSKGLAGAATTTFLERVVAQGEMIFGARAPGLAPIVPSFEHVGDARVVTRVDPVRGEARSPIGNRRL